MSLKKNFYQALSELLGGESSSGPAPEHESAAFQAAPEPVAEPQASSAQSPVPPAADQADAGFSAPLPGRETPPSNSTWKNPFLREPPSRKQADSGPAAQSVYQPVNEMTVISKNTVILGDIRSLANVTIEGNVRGRVEVLKDATVQGMLVGDLACKNVRMQGSSVQGNVLIKENAFIDHNSTVLGDLAAQHASIDGRVKGNIRVNSKAELLENAVIAGDIHASTIAVADGANIKGFVSTAYLSENGDAAFPGQIIIDEDSFVGIG